MGVHLYRREEGFWYPILYFYLQAEEEKLRGREDSFDGVLL